jgi:chromosome segregation ATPase
MIETIYTVAKIIALIGGGVFVIGYMIAQFRNGGAKQASQQTIDNTKLIESLENRYNALQREMERQAEDHKAERERWHKESGELRTELGRLQGVVQEKDGKLAEYKEIFQGRNPQLDEFIKSSGEFQTKLMEFMSDMKNHFVNGATVIQNNGGN